jgi:ABC-type glycerol-3-phosphate transport system substrate-binding protein
MKKVILALAVVTVLASCGGSTTGTESTCDTCVVKTDSTVVVDTTKTTVDTTKVVDSTKEVK